MSDGPDLTFVLLASPDAPDPAKVVESASKLGISLTVVDASDIQSYDVGNDRTLFVMTMTAPHPDAPMGFGPTAANPQDAVAAPAHMIITAMGLTGTPRERDTLMAALTASVVDNVAAVGVMLGHGAVFHKPKVFSGLAALGAEHGEIPAELAVDITTDRESETRMSMRTHNLPRYGREDFYVTCPIKGKGALDFIMGLVRWMLRDPTKTLPTGETVGRSADEKIVIRRIEDATGATVILLDLP